MAAPSRRLLVAGSFLVLAAVGGAAGSDWFAEQNPYGTVEFAGRLPKPPARLSGRHGAQHHRRRGGAGVSSRATLASADGPASNWRDKWWLRGSAREKFELRPATSSTSRRPGLQQAWETPAPAPPEDETPLSPAEDERPSGPPAGPPSSERPRPRPLPQPAEPEQDPDLCKYDWCNAGDYEPVCVTYFTTYHRAFTLRNRKCIDFNNNCVKHQGTLSWCHEDRCYDDSIKFCNPAV